MIVRKMKWAAASLVSAIAISLAGGGSVIAADEAYTFDFASCVQNSGTGSVLLLMDESISVYGRKGTAGSDPKSYRITAAKIMLDKLQEVSDAYDAPINVLLGGLGDQFKVRSSGNNGWSTLAPGQTGPVSELKSVADKWGSLPSDSNSRETDLYSSIEGAQRALAQQSECKLLVLFKDGADYQYFNPDVATPVSDPAIQSALEAGNGDLATKLAEEELCREGGLADGLRPEGTRTGTYLLTVALGADTNNSDFGNVKAFTEGGSCGSLPGFGKFLLVPNAIDLPGQFARVLDPGFIPENRQDAFTFNMTNALSSIRILTSGQLSAFANYTILPPATCVGGKTVFKMGGAIEGSFGPGVSWQSNWYSPEVFKITIDKEEGATDECWVGTWTVQPTGSEKNKSTSVLEFDANLQALAVFSDKDFYLVPDGDSKEFGIELSKVSAKQKVDVTSLDPSLSLSLSAELQDARGAVISTVFEGVRIADFSTRQLLDPKGLSVGDYRLVMTLEASVDGLGVPLRPVRTETTISVRNKNRTPQVVGVVDFGDIDGKGVAEQEITVNGSPDAAFVLHFDDPESKVVATQHPAGLAYEFTPSSSGASFEIPKGSAKTKIKVAIRTTTKDEVNKRGLVSGDLQVKAVPVGSESNAEVLSIPFTAYQTPEANVGSQLAFILLGMLFGLAVSLGAMRLMAWLVARFPSGQDVANYSIEAIALEGTIIGDNFVTSSQVSEAIADSAQWQIVGVESHRRKAQVANMDFQTKPAGLMLKSAGSAFPSDERYVGWSASGETFSSGRPLMPLGLQGQWMFLIDRGDLPVSGELDDGTAGIPAKLVLIYGDRDSGPHDSGFDFGGAGLGSFGDATSAARRALFTSASGSIREARERLFKSSEAKTEKKTKQPRSSKRKPEKSDANAWANQNLFDQNDPFG